MTMYLWIEGHKEMSFSTFRGTAAVSALLLFPAPRNIKTDDVECIQACFCCCCRVRELLCTFIETRRFEAVRFLRKFDGQLHDMCLVNDNSRL